LFAVDRIRFPFLFHQADSAGAESAKPPENRLAHVPELVVERL
jgi:hypothetical protein